MHNYFNNNPLVLIVLFVAVSILVIHLSRRFKFVPCEKHKPTDHHWWGAVLVVLGLLSVAGLISLGYGDAILEVSDEAVEIVKEAVD